MWKASSVTTQQEWIKVMETIKSIEEGAYNWLIAIPPPLWCKHVFSSYPKCEATLNNMCEAFNSTILEARDKPIIGMIEWVRLYLMKRFQENKQKMKNVKGKICQKIQKKLEENDPEVKSLRLVGVVVRHT